MKAVRKIIEIDEERCDGCGQCVIACAEGAIAVVNGKARLVKDSYCDGLGACLGECPQGALKIHEREAEEFDPEAVEVHLAEQEKTGKTLQAAAPCECPSTQVRLLQAAPETAAHSVAAGDITSALTHWPIQIRLVPPNAPFLKGAELLVAADCTAVAYANFHRDFLKGKVLLMGCPKFDDVPQYLKKFSEIFKAAAIQKVTVLEMEVPCCSALPAIVKKGMLEAGQKIPLEEVVIGVQGKVLRRMVPAA